MLRYTLTYKKPKKKGYYANETATFLDPEGAELWRQHLEKNNCKDIQIVVS
jgi:hypothetical protein